jgi:hydroxysqualene dehydroxylase
MAQNIYIIGAGLAGLSAAVRLAARGANVTVYEANAQAGGRCRTYHDHGLGLMIDNGNHLLLSGNHAARSFLQKLGTEDRLIGPEQAEFPFVDLASGERWTLRPNESRVPWWILDPNRRVPGTKLADYLALVRFLRPVAQQQTVGEILNCEGALYDRLLQPVLLAALNIDPPEGSAKLAAAIVRETFAAGGKAYRPLIARDGLSGAFIDPAIAFIEQHGGAVRLGAELRALAFEGQRVAGLEFSKEQVALQDDDTVILAVPPWTAALLVPDLEVPTEFRSILNAHFKIAPPAGTPPITGAVNGLVEWLFAFPDRLSVTISSADRLMTLPREEVAADIWSDVSRIAGIADALPPWQIVRERRATFAASVEQDMKRPAAQTAWTNLLLAGDWTATGLPATIEGAVRSGHTAADAVAADAVPVPSQTQ